MMAKLMSCCEVRQDDDQRKSIVQQDMQQSTFFLRRVIEGTGRGHTVVRGPSLPPTSACRFHLVGLDGAHEKSATGGARHAAASTTGGTQTESWPHRTAADPAEAKVFRAHAPPAA